MYKKSILALFNKALKLALSNHFRVPKLQMFPTQMSKVLTSPHYHLRSCAGSLGNQNSSNKKLKSIFSSHSLPFPLVLTFLCFFLLHAIANFGSTAERWWDTCLLGEIPTAIFGQYLAWTASSLRTERLTVFKSLMSHYDAPKGKFYKTNATLITNSSNPLNIRSRKAPRQLFLWEYKNQNHCYFISKTKINTVYTKSLFIYFVTVFFFKKHWSSVGLSQKAIIQSSLHRINRCWKY